VIRSLVAALGLAALNPLVATKLAAQQDSLGRVRALMLRETAPLDSRLRELPRLLRPDSGTVRADSSFEQWKKGYDALVDSIGRRFQTEMIQCLIDPGGATAQRLGGCANRAVADSLRSLLEHHGVLAYDGEGDMYYSASAVTLRQQAGRFLTRPLQELVELWAVEDRIPVGGDASLSVSWDELTRRLAIADRLVTNRHPVAFGADLRHHLVVYLGALMGNWDNTSGFSLTPPYAFSDDFRLRLQHYAAQYPATRGGGIVKDYLQLLAANGWRRTDAVRDFLHRAMRQAEQP